MHKKCRTQFSRGKFVEMFQGLVDITKGLNDQSNFCVNKY